MKRGALLAAIAIASLAGCEDGRAPEGARQTKQIRVANPHHDELMALPADLQRLGLMRAVRQTGNRCQRVEAGRHQQTYEGLEMWVALCSEGKHWAVFVAPNGDIQVRDCDQADELDLPQCRPVTGTGAGPATAQEPTGE